MKKTICVITALVLLLLTSCSSTPNTNLEFWICDNVDNVDFSKYQQKFGLMGGREYYGSGYIPTKDENGEQQDPPHCVVYTVTSYPDYSSNKSHITRICITDPSVELYGLTLNSSFDDIETTMKRNGYKTESSSHSYGIVASKGKVSIRFSKEEIIITVKISNIFGIVF